MTLSNAKDKTTASPTSIKVENTEDATKGSTEITKKIVYL